MTKFWKNYKVQKFANFRIKIIPNVDSLWSYFEKKNSLQWFSMRKESDLLYFYLKTVKIVEKSEIFWKVPEIAEDHNFRTEYATNVKFVSRCAVLDFQP